MQTKNIACFLSVLLFFSGSLFTVDALPDQSISLHGVGITINLTFPEEAHPLDNISHNITITADTTLIVKEYTLLIYAPVNSIWQVVKNQTLTDYDLQQNQNFSSSAGFILPQDTNGTIWCFIYVLTDQSVDHFSATFPTTHVSVLTFTEIQSTFNELLSNYTILQSKYNMLLDNYNILLANYSGLLTDYESLLGQYNSLSTDYNYRVGIYEALQNTYNALSAEHKTLNSNYETILKKYNSLQSNFDSLNSTRNSLQASYDSLNNTYRSLNQTYFNLKTQNDDFNQTINESKKALSSDKIVMFVFIVTLVILILIIAYIKRRKTEPYMVIRKETVTMKPDETS
jgi:hypothetical protein